MPYYLSQYTGTGAARNPFTPVGAEQPGSGSVDLRGDGTQATGFALVFAPSAFSDPRATLLTDVKVGTLPNSIQNRIKNLLSVNFTDTTLPEIFGNLLLNPPPGKWNALTGTRSTMRHELWLSGDLLWSKAAKLGPEGDLIDPTDSFTRANETPLAAPWTKLTGSAGTMNLESNAVRNADVADADNIYYYSGSAATADQYCQFVQSAEGPDGLWGACVRIGAASGFDAYVASAWNPTEAISKWVGGSFSTVAGVTVNVVDTDTVRIEAQGSTLRYFVNGSQVTGSPATDTDLTTAGNGCGMWIGQRGATPLTLDNFDGGDLATAATGLPLQAWKPNFVYLRKNR